jgi:hypothetical protein
MRLNEVVEELKNICRRFSELIIDINYVTVDESITWDNYLSGLHNHVNYLYEYRWMIDNRQYSFLLSDGGALQFYYNFSGGELLSSRQCYYPPPFNGDIDDHRELDLAISLDDLLSVDGDEEGGSPYRAKHWSHIRLDFDANVATHDPSHLQYSARNAFRIPADRVLYPLVFLDLILRDFYRAAHAEYASKTWYQPMLAQSARCGLASRVGRVEAIRISCP